MQFLRRVHCKVFYSVLIFHSVLFFHVAAEPAEMEQTFIAVKPDGVLRGLCGEIIRRFEAKGFKLVAAKFIQVN